MDNPISRLFTTSANGDSPSPVGMPFASLAGNNGGRDRPCSVSYERNDGDLQNRGLDLDRIPGHDAVFAIVFRRGKDFRRGPVAETEIGCEKPPGAVE